MRAQDVMSTRIKSVTAETAADAAWNVMRDHRIHHLVVMSGHDIAGVLSDRDAGGAKGAAVRAGHAVADLMTEDVITVAPDTPVRKVANVMRGRSAGCVVVTDRPGHAVGIVTTSDLLELLGRGAVRPAPVGRRPALNHRAPHRKRNRAYGVW
jgi:acetoin utilization protein AcuB